VNEQEREYHPVADLFPPMSSEEYEELKASIAKNGLQVPIWLHPDSRIIDGRHRHRACIDTDTPMQFRTWNGVGSLVSFVVALNLDRRHLTPGQKAAVAVDALPRYEAEARERQAGGQGGVLLSQIIDEGKTGKAAELAARDFGTNRQYVHDAKRLAADAPELFEQVKAGNLTIPKAKKIKKQRETMESVRAYTEQVKDSQTFDKVYNVIYADPPWDYGYQNPEGVNIASAHYHTMPIDDICSFLGDSGINVANDAVLFLWVTNPFLEKALQVVKAWGFTYKTNMVWVKTERKRPGAGHYIRGQHELLFICTRGSFTPLDKHISPPIGSVLEYPQREHSEKPDELYQTIERLYPDCTYLEIFARGRRAGWEAIGNDA
jgi:N6-adenosine-specific RNA methylase IME4